VPIQVLEKRRGWRREGVEKEIDWRREGAGEGKAANYGSCPNIDSATEPKVALTAVVIW
jgi:hypothetical protein